MLNSFDINFITKKAEIDNNTQNPNEKQLDIAKKDLINNAVAVFLNPELRQYIENVRKSHDQIIDNINLDTVTFVGYDSTREETANKIISTFRDFIERNKDEITALNIIYNEKYGNRHMAIDKLKELYEKLKSKNITVKRLWDCYAIKKPERVKTGTMAQLSDLISLIRFEVGQVDTLSPFADKVNYNFMRWTFQSNTGAIHFTEEQMEWLCLIKEHIISSLSIEPEDLDLSPFDHKGGLGKFYEVFGENYKSILDEINIRLVA